MRPLKLKSSSPGALAREVERLGVALARQAVDRRAARIAESQQTSALVERLAGRVVERLAEHLVGGGVVDARDEGVPSARHEAEVGRLDRVVAQRASHDVPVEVIHGHQRQLARRGDGLRGRDSDEQRADQPGPARDRDRVDVVQPGAGPLQRVRGHRVDQLQVMA